MTTLHALASVPHKARTPFADPRTLASLRRVAQRPPNHVCGSRTRRPVVLHLSTPARARHPPLTGSAAGLMTCRTGAIHGWIDAVLSVNGRNVNAEGGAQ